MPGILCQGDSGITTGTAFTGTGSKRERHGQAFPRAGDAAFLRALFDGKGRDSGKAGRIAPVW